jgi:hypothetical protein
MSRYSADDNHEALLEAQTDLYYETVGSICCEPALDFGPDETMYGFDHAETCDHYDGAPLYRPGMGPGDPVRCNND